MSNELQKHKTSDTVKWVLTLLAFILVGIMLTGIMLGWFDKKADNPMTGEQQQTETSGFEIDEVYNTKSMSLAVSTYAASVPNSYTVTATVTPSTAKNKNVDWSVEFVNALSAWAKGKTASSYVKVTPASTGSATATVTCSQAFGEKVKVVAKSNDNASISAYCVCEYYERISAVTGSFTGLDNFDTSKSVNEWSYSTSGKVSTATLGDMNGLYEITVGYGTSSTAYTIAENLHSMEVTLEPTQEFRTAMKAKYSDYECAPVSFMGNNGSVAMEVPQNYGTGCYFPLTGMTTLSDLSGDPIFMISICDYANEILCANPNMSFMNVTVKIEGDYNDFTTTFKVKAKQSSLPTSATGLKVDKTILNF